jgi:hypothetical protein
MREHACRDRKRPHPATHAQRLNRCLPRLQVMDTINKFNCPKRGYPVKLMVRNPMIKSYKYITGTNNLTDPHRGDRAHSER